MTEARRLAAEKRGRRSETFAALLLMLKGYRILGRRVRTHAGEIDLIAATVQRKKHPMKNIFGFGRILK